MSIGRITMIEFTSDEALEAAIKLYLATQKEYFPNAQIVINIKTGPTSLISIAIYPSFEDAASNLEGREKMMEQLSPVLKDGFFHEGEITYHFIKPPDIAQD